MRLTISNNKLLICIHKDKITITKLNTLYSYLFLLSKVISKYKKIKIIIVCWETIIVIYFGKRRIYDVEIWL
jgi:hypothetical protein